jgi:TolA-binding protein
MVWRQTEADLRNQLALAAASAAVVPAPKSLSDVTGLERAELERLRNAQSTWERDAAQLRQQLTAANDRATKLQQAESSLRKSNEELQARLDKVDSSPARPPDTSGIEQLLREFQAAYERRDVKAVVTLWPSAPSAELTKTFSQMRAYEMEILDPQISVAGNTAVVTCTRRVSMEPRVGSRQAPILIPSIFRLKQSGGVWTIESVEKR